MSKDLFGAVEPMEMDNWEVETTEAKQKELQDFQKSHPSLPFTSLHFFWMLKGQFGLVDTMVMENWDWETTQTETKQKRFQDFQESTQFQQEIITLILLMKREVFGCGYNGNGQLGLGHSTNQSKAVRNDRLVNIVAASGGDCCSMFLDKDGNLFTCGRNQYGQLGLGDKTDRNIPEKVNNVPKICSLSPGCTSRHNVAVDRSEEHT